MEDAEGMKGTVCWEVYFYWLEKTCFCHCFLLARTVVDKLRL